MSNEGRDGGAAVSVADDLFELLPEGCIANVLSLTSPRDACRLSMVGLSFKSAAESDGVWERFLPCDYKDIVGRAVDPPSPRLLFTSKKHLYFWLSDHSLIIDNGTKSFSLEKWSGKKCYMLAARELSIVWGDTPTYWRWTSLSESRFSEVAELISVCWLEIHGKINTSLLSPNTTYAAYLVFKSTETAYGFEYQPAEVAVGIAGVESEKRTVYLDPDRQQRQQFQIIPRQTGLFNRIRTRMLMPLAAYISRESESESESESNSNSNRSYPKARGDGWMEIELGEYFNKGGEDGELEMSLMEVRSGDWKSGLIVQGIDIRPKEGE